MNEIHFASPCQEVLGESDALVLKKMIRYPVIQSIDVWTENTVLMRKADIQNGIAQEVEVTIAGDVRAIVLGVTVRDVANENQKDKSIVMNILIFPR